MDSHGVPQKINRHVYKAINFYMSHKDGSSFPEIYQFVKLCNRNLSPVRNLKETVHKALDTFCRVGLVQKDRLQKYKIQTGFNKKQPNGNKDSGAYSESSGTAKKRKNSSSSSFESDNETKSKKRIRGTKKTMENRKGKKTDLPRARRQPRGGGGGSNTTPTMATMVPTSSNFNIIQKDEEENRDTQRGGNLTDADLAEQAEEILDMVDELAEPSEVDTNQQENNSTDQTDANDNPMIS